ncbi:leucine-rich_repeat domain-containing protein [Hexamita inflata]|uniref:Leucine-rich repeat domain-containing protein n=1 Tax=Hexamita inflata TaxID=28002 RepID=A0AA86U7L6_9EUKA|nr:leucine-rich repeat domain-containing protein [Hexamita inflata]
MESMDSINDVDQLSIDLGDSMLENLSFIQKGNYAAKIIYLFDNRLMSLNQLSTLKNLTSINASWNKIQSTSFVEHLPNLRYLLLQFNQIDDLSGLRGHANLQYLDISFNRILEPSQLEPLRNNVALNHLVLYDTIQVHDMQYKQNAVTTSPLYPQYIYMYLNKRLQKLDKNAHMVNFSLLDNERNLLGREHHYTGFLYENEVLRKKKHALELGSFKYKQFLEQQTEKERFVSTRSKLINCLMHKMQICNGEDAETIRQQIQTLRNEIKMGK